MKLKTQIVLALVLVIALIAVGLAFQQVRTIRNSIAEETETAGSIGTQMLSRVHEIYQSQGVRPMQRFLTRLGRLRGHDIVLLDEYGFVLYRTPATSYLEDTNVPDWFTRAVSPETEVREFQIQGAKLLVRTESSRAISKAWEEFRNLFVAIVIGFIVLSLLVWWFIDRALRPFEKVTTALRAVGQGNYKTRLPELRSAEAKEVGQSFNFMASSLEDSMAALEAEAIAKSELQKNRELTQAIQRRIEDEHRSLAQELHDELGQHVTAIKSMGMSMQRRESADAQIVNTAGHIVESATSIHAAIRHMLVHLRPASLDQFGLVDAIEDLVSDWGVKHPAKTFNLQCKNLPDNISPETSTVVYRIAQEALTNAVRHSGADSIHVTLDADRDKIYLCVQDNGQGMSQNDKPGFGITGMKERATAASGVVSVYSDAQGCTISLELPIYPTSPQEFKQ